MKKFYALLFSLFTLFLFAAPPQVVTSVTPDETIVTSGTVIRFTGRITRGDGVPENAKVIYEEFFNGIRTRTGDLAFDENVTLEYQSGEAGWYMVRLSVISIDNKPLTVGGRYISGGRGMMIDPQDIPASSVRPADFDEFWNSRRALLDTIPIQELERRQIDYRGDFADRVVVCDVKVSCAGSKPVSGILTMPKDAAEKSLPAIVHFQGAGVHSATPTAHYALGAISFMINANGNENLREKEYYDALRNGELRNYMQKDKHDREKFHFHDMFLRVMRALDYVKSLPQWNGRILVVSGGSQGGAQAIVAAAMDPQVTLMIAEVPAMCDHHGYLMTPRRRQGWPWLYYDDKNPAVIETASYYDMVNFASRIRCESFITAGMTDMICSPVGVTCVFNAIPVENKHFLIHPTGDHVGPQRDAAFRRTWVNRMFAHFKER